MATRNPELITNVPVTGREREANESHLPFFERLRLDTSIKAPRSQGILPLTRTVNGKDQFAGFLAIGRKNVVVVGFSPTDSHALILDISRDSVRVFSPLNRKFHPWFTRGAIRQHVHLDGPYAFPGELMDVFQYTAADLDNKLDGKRTVNSIIQLIEAYPDKTSYADKGVATEVVRALMTFTDTALRITRNEKPVQNVLQKLRRFQEAFAFATTPHELRESGLFGHAENISMLFSGDRRIRTFGNRDIAPRQQTVTRRVPLKFPSGIRPVVGSHNDAPDNHEAYEPWLIDKSRKTNANLQPETEEIITTLLDQTTEEITEVLGETPFKYAVGKRGLTLTPPGEYLNAEPQNAGIWRKFRSIEITTLPEEGIRLTVTANLGTIIIEHLRISDPTFVYKDPDGESFELSIKADDTIYNFLKAVTRTLPRSLGTHFGHKITKTKHILMAHIQKQHEVFLLQ